MGNSCKPRPPLLAKLAKGLASAAHSCSLSAARGNHQLQPLPALRPPGPLWRREEFPTPFGQTSGWAPSSYRISSENSRHSQLFSVGLVLFCKFCVNSPPLSSLSLLLLLLLSTPLGVRQPLDYKFESQTQGSTLNARLQPSLKIVTPSGMHDGFSSHSPGPEVP